MKRKFHRKKYTKDQKIQHICKIICYTAIINFLVFIVIYQILGRNALSGKETAGHFYFPAKNGQSIEVSFPFFLYSKTHATTLFFTHSLGLIAVLIFLIFGRRKEELGRF
jgi:hypothetical protein